MIKESDISRFLHSRYALMLFAVIAIITTYLASSWGKVSPILDNKGLGLTPINQWLEPGMLSQGINIALNFVMCVILIYINKTFNILRNPTLVFAWLFLVLQMPLIDLTGQLYGGTVMAVVILVCAFIMFVTYNANSPYEIFLVFAIISFGAFFQYAFIFYAPVFLVGCVQMRTFNIRTILAALMGIITPAWIMYGLGILKIQDFTMPQFVGIYTQLSSLELIQMLIAIGLSIIICIGSWMANIVKIISYNAQNRAFNGFFAILSLATILLIMIDFTNYIVYVPLLNCCTALQLGHLFTIYESRRSYLGIIAIVVVYTALYIWGVCL
ncbi:MAG: hypothetical protein IKV32_00820 [Muribaculaceae bacterium]|nr:hypothetical protein [Muribaculaceae bacterium]